MDALRSILNYLYSLNETQTGNKEKNQFIVADEKILKSFKDRFNYASSTCSARILSSNPETLSASAVLSSNKDTYLRNPCSLRNKFLVLELCEEIKVDGIALGNYELFSSTFKGFKVYAAIKSSDPSRQTIWKLLLSAEMSSDSKFLHSEQAFPIESGLFFKYLRIEFADERYGHEELCPLSTLKVYGKNMIDEFNEGNKGANGNEIINYEDAGLKTSEELKVIYKQMEEISINLALIDAESSKRNPNVFFNICPLEESETQVLRDSYAELERQAFLLQQTALAATKSNGNIFKRINDRLEKLEISLKNPLNLILFRSTRSTGTDNEQTSGNNNIPPANRLIMDSSNERSFEEIISSMNQNLFDLQSDYQRIQSELAIQHTKISILFLFNFILVLVILLQFVLKRRRDLTSSTASKQQSNALKRLPLLDLKSPNSKSSSLSHSASSFMRSSGSRENVACKNTPGVVLSDDEVLLLDDERERSTEIK